MPTSNLAINRIPVGGALSFELNLKSVPDLTFARPLSGSVCVIITAEDQAEAEFSIAGALECECDRCLNTFSQPFEERFRAQYCADQGEIDDESYPIARGEIDTLEPIRQHLLTHLPMKQICADNCAGIPITANK